MARLFALPLALVFVLVARAWISLGSYSTFLRMTARVPRCLSTRRASVRRARGAAWAVDRSARIVPGATCLTQALAAALFLRLLGHSSELVIGVHRGAGSGFQAHAWLCHGGRVLTGGPSNRIARFSVITRLAVP